MLVGSGHGHFCQNQATNHPIVEVGSDQEEGIADAHQLIESVALPYPKEVDLPTIPAYHILPRGRSPYHILKSIQKTAKTVFPA